MSKKLAIFSVVLGLCVVGMAFISGCEGEATATSEKNQSVSEKKVQTLCPASLDSSEKKACNLDKKVDACPLDKKVDACLPDGDKKDCEAKQKAGTCPMSNKALESSKADCSKKTDAQQK